MAEKNKEIESFKSELETETEGTKRESMGLPQLIFMQVDRINKALTLSGLPESLKTRYCLAKSFLRSVGALESMVYPYIDSEYIKGVENLNKILRESEDHGASAFIRTAYATGEYRYRLLMDLLHRKNLLLMKDTTEREK